MTLFDYLVEEGSEVFALFPTNVEELYFMGAGLLKTSILIFIAFFLVLISIYCISYVMKI